MRYVIVTGEVSGDLIGAAIATALLAKDSATQLYAMGGQELKRAGAEIIQDSTELAIMGFSSLPKKVLHIRGVYQNMCAAIERIKPDVIIYVDSAGFNLRLGRWAKKRGYKNIYIAPPKTWASRAWRNRAIQRDFDLLITLFPFANEYFSSQGFNSTFCGHPLLQSLHQAPTSHYQNSILIAPGSRIQEIQSTLPVLREFIIQSPQRNFILSKIASHSSTIYSSYLDGLENVTISEEPLQHLLRQVDLAIITSGTATLEAAIIGVPQVVIYRTSTLNYIIAKRLIKTDYISLPNLILNKKVVPELIQAELTSKTLIQAIDNMALKREDILNDYTQITELYKQHDATNEIATAIMAQTTTI